MKQLFYLAFIFCLIYGGYLLITTISNYLLDREETDAVSNGKTVVAVVWTFFVMPIIVGFSLIMLYGGLFLLAFISLVISYLLMKYWFP
jgi:hypothetical protein